MMVVDNDVKGVGEVALPVPRRDVTVQEVLRIGYGDLMVAARDWSTIRFAASDWSA
jgi:hypothetical protein